MNVDRAQREWANRPDEERFASLHDLALRVRDDRERSSTMNPVTRSTIRVEPTPEGDLVWNGCRFTNHSFRQVSQLGGAPAGFLTELPAPLAADALNHVLRKHNGHDTAQNRPYVRKLADGSIQLRAMTGMDYTRVYHADLVEGMERMAARGWVVPPEWKGRPSGIYYGDRSLFVFLIDDASRSIVTHPDATKREDLARFVMIGNSEEGQSSFHLTLGWFRFVCGNHMVWGAESVTDLRLRHVGQIQHKLARQFSQLMLKAADQRMLSDDRDGIRLAMVERYPGAEAVDMATGEKKLVEILAPALNRASGGEWGEPLAQRALRQAIADDLDPRTRWGAINGLTALGRDSRFKDQGVEYAKLARYVMPKANRKALPAAVQS